jgi:hypothetical protein
VLAFVSYSLSAVSPATRSGMTSAELSSTFLAHSARMQSWGQANDRETAPLGEQLECLRRLLDVLASELCLDPALFADQGGRPSMPALDCAAAVLEAAAAQRQTCLAKFNQLLKGSAAEQEAGAITQEALNFLQSILRAPWLAQDNSHHPELVMRVVKLLTALNSLAAKPLWAALAKLVWKDGLVQLQTVGRFRGGVPQEAEFAAGGAAGDNVTSIYEMIFEQLLHTLEDKYSPADVEALCGERGADGSVRQTDHADKRAKVFKFFAKQVSGGLLTTAVQRHVARAAHTARRPYE